MEMKNEFQATLNALMKERKLGFSSGAPPVMSTIFIPGLSTIVIIASITVHGIISVESDEAA